MMGRMVWLVRRTGFTHSPALVRCRWLRRVSVTCWSSAAVQAAVLVPVAVGAQGGCCPLLLSTSTLALRPLSLARVGRLAQHQMPLLTLLARAGLHPELGLTTLRAAVVLAGQRLIALMA